MSVFRELEEVFDKHLDVAGSDLYELADSFYNQAYSTDYCLYDGPKDLAALDRLSLGLASLDHNVLDQMSGAAKELLSKRLRVGTDDNMKQVEEFIERTGGLYSLAFREFTSLAPGIRTIVDAVRNEIDISDRKRRTLQTIEMERLQIVEYAVDFWRRFNRKDIPTTNIKPAQPFAKFLADVFFVVK